MRCIDCEYLNKEMQSTKDEFGQGLSICTKYNLGMRCTDEDLEKAECHEDKLKRFVTDPLYKLCEKLREEMRRSNKGPTQTSEQTGFCE